MYILSISNLANVHTNALWCMQGSGWGLRSTPLPGLLVQTNNQHPWLITNSCWLTTISWHNIGPGVRVRQGPTERKSWNRLQRSLSLLAWSVLGRRSMLTTELPSYSLPDHVRRLEDYVKQGRNPQARDPKEEIPKVGVLKKRDITLYSFSLPCICRFKYHYSCRLDCLLPM